MGGVTLLEVAFDAGLPVARWGPLFHVLCMEQPTLRLTWRRLGFPKRELPLLGGADVGLLLHPPPRPGVEALALDASPLVIVMAVGHRLAGNHALLVADVLGEPFPRGTADVDPEWSAFWTLDHHRGRPPESPDDEIGDAEEGLEVVVSGGAIAMLPEWAAAGLAHPGVVTVPLIDGPQVETRLVWRSDDNRPIVRALVDLARAWTQTQS